MMKAPTRAALDMVAPYESRLKNSRTNCIVAFRKLLETAFHHHFPLVQQRQTVGDGLRAVKIVRDDDGRQGAFVVAA